MMWNIAPLFCGTLCCVVFVTTVSSGRTGKFRLSDDGIKGDGSYTLTNQSADINLHLIIGNLLRSPMLQAVNVPILKPQPRKDSPNVTKNVDKELIGKNQTKQENMEHHNQSKESTANSERLSDKDLTFANDGLAEHNRFRKVHGSTPLNLDRQMSFEAQDFARQLAKLGTLKHSARDSRPGQGENLAMGCSSGDSTMPAAAATKKWYDEVCNYDFTNNNFQKACGHFSQIVWKSTGSLGIGKATGTKWGMNCTFIVARYGPQGNIANLIKDNVEKGSFDISYCNTVTRTTLEKNENGPEDDESFHGYYPDYGLNEGFLNDEGEGMKSIGFREKIPRVKSTYIQVL